jgi:hypothetical protein
VTVSRSSKPGVPRPGGCPVGGTTGTGSTALVDPDAGLPGAAHNGVARLDPRADVRPGARVTLRLDPSRLYFFDAPTGQAISWPAAQAESAVDAPHSHPAVPT